MECTKPIVDVYSPNFRRPRSASHDERIAIVEQIKSMRDPKYTCRTIPTADLWREIKDFDKSLYSKGFAFRHLYAGMTPSVEAISMIASILESSGHAARMISFGTGLGLWERLIHDHISSRSVNGVGNEIVAIDTEYNRRPIDENTETYYPVNRVPSRDPVEIATSTVAEGRPTMVFIHGSWRGSVSDLAMHMDPNYIVCVEDNEYWRRADNVIPTSLKEELDAIAASRNIQYAKIASIVVPQWTLGDREQVLRIYKKVENEHAFYKLNGDRRIQGNINHDTNHG